MECGICMSPYDDLDHKPILIGDCGHVVCMVCRRKFTVCPSCRKRISRKVITVYQLIGAPKPSIKEDVTDGPYYSVDVEYMLKWLEDYKKDRPGFSRDWNCVLMVAVEEVLNALNGHHIEDVYIDVVSAWCIRLENDEMELKLDVVWKNGTWTVYGESPHIRGESRNLIRTQRAISRFWDPFRTQDPNWPYESYQFHRIETIREFVSKAQAYWLSIYREEEE